MKTAAIPLLCGALLFAAPLAAHEHAAPRAPLAASAAFGQDGRLWLATIRDGHVWVAFSEDQGKTFGAPAMVNPQPENIAGDGENRPKIALAENGAIYLSYTQSLDKPYTGHIRFARSLDGGKSFSAPLTVNDNREAISHRFDSMAINSRGEIYLAWLDKRDQDAAARNKRRYPGAALYYAVSRDGGASFAPNVKLADHSCECCRVALAIDADGTPVAIWRHVFGKDVRDHAIARLDGKAVPRRVSEDGWALDACPHHGPALAIGADGTWHAAWFTGGKARQGLFYARSQDQGRHFSPPLGFGDGSAQPGHPHLLGVGKQVYLAWKEFDGKHSVIRVMRSGDDGASWDSPRNVAQTAGASDHPLLIAHGQRAYLSWNTAQDGYRLIDVTGTQ